MGLFNRKKEDPAPANAAMAELGREYAIARRHKDRKTVKRIERQVGNDFRSEADVASFQQGQEAYDAIPPIPRPRCNRRR